MRLGGNGHAFVSLAVIRNISAYMYTRGCLLEILKEHSVSQPLMKGRARSLRATVMKDDPIRAKIKHQASVTKPWYLISRNSLLGCVFHYTKLCVREVCILVDVCPSTSSANHQCSSQVVPQRARRHYADKVIEVTQTPTQTWFCKAQILGHEALVRHLASKHGRASRAEEGH